MNETFSAEDSEVKATLRFFSEIVDQDAASRFADAHPELRTPYAVAFLVNAGTRTTDDGQRRRLHTCAAQLYRRAGAGGQRQTDGLNLLTDLVLAETAFEARPHEHALASQAVDAARHVIQAAPTSDMDPVLLGRTLAVTSSVLIRAYATISDHELLGEAVAAQRKAVHVTPEASAEWPNRLGNLGVLLSMLYRVTGDRALLDENVALQRQMVRAMPGTSLHLSRYLNNLAEHLAGLYETTCERALLDEAVAIQRRAVRAAPETSPNLPTLLTNLGLHLRALYGASGEHALLEESVAVQRQSVEITRDTSAEGPGHLNNLALTLADLYRAGGDRAVLEEVVRMQRRAVRVTPETSPDRCRHLSNLAKHLADLYAVTGEYALLGDAVVAQRQAVRAAPRTSPDLPFLLGNLAALLDGMYNANGDLSLLDEAIHVHRQAVLAAPDTSPNLPLLLTNLANSLSELYVARDDRSALDEAVAVQRRAVEATPEGSIGLPIQLNNVSKLLAELHAATGERGLLDEAVAAQRRAVRTAPETSAERPRYLNNLGLCLANLHAATGGSNVLREAIAASREAVRIAPETSIYLPQYLNNLTAHLRAMYMATGDSAPLEEVVATQRRAVRATPEASTYLPQHLNNLATYLADLYEVTGKRALLEEALAVQRRAVQITPETSTDRPRRLNNLAACLTNLYEANNDRDLLDEASGLVSGVDDGGPWVRAILARTRARLARVDERRSDRYEAAARELAAALDSFQDALERPDTSLQERRDLAHRIDGTLGDLVASLLLNGDTGQAVALLEGNRIWLTTPSRQTHEWPEPPTAVAWIATSRWETMVVTTPDHHDRSAFTSRAVDMTSEQIRNALNVALNVAQIDTHDSIASVLHASAARRQATEVLCELAGKIVAVLPPAERLLIVPLGMCALLPYAAASHPDGGFLIDQTTITLAPSLAWARAAGRRRPRGRSVGAFHAGRRIGRRLNLREDRQAFADLVAGEVLDQPTAEEVLARIAGDTVIGHFSCHGAASPFTPLASGLELESDLTIQAVLDHGRAPWLVNLSACETAVPDLQAAEQHISFPTGFLLGGAAHVIATLWPVSNTYATVVNRAFYQQLAANEHPADALRHALHHVRGTLDRSSAAGVPRGPIAAQDQPAPVPVDHPYWWASFAHHGSPW